MVHFPSALTRGGVLVEGGIWGEKNWVASDVGLYGRGGSQSRFIGEIAKRDCERRYAVRKKKKKLADADADFLETNQLANANQYYGKSTDLEIY
jgi:hypothetical protein